MNKCNDTGEDDDEEADGTEDKLEPGADVEVMKEEELEPDRVARVDVTRLDNEGRWLSKCIWKT